MNYLPAHLLPGARAGAEVVAGVRPESVTLAPAGTAAALAATVETGRGAEPRDARAPALAGEVERPCAG
jgi:hypothetical protein